MSRVAAGAVVAMLGACFGKPVFQAREDALGDGAGADSEVDAGGCGSLVHDTFEMDQATPCAPWGNLLGDVAHVDRDLGGLKIFGTDVFVAGCITSSFDFANGASVRIGTPSTSMSDYTNFIVTPKNGQPTSIRILWSSGAYLLYFTTHQNNTMSTSFSSDLMKWFKVEPTILAGRFGITASYSLDGITWLEIGTDDYGFIAPDPQVTLELSVAGMGEGNSIAVFDDLNVLTCPPAL